MTEQTIEAPTVDAFALDAGQGAPGIVPALVLATEPLRLGVSYLNGTIREHTAAEAPLPASDVAEIEDLPLHDGTVMWVVSLTTTAPAGTWIAFWDAHCAELHAAILGEWRPGRSVPALHVRGTTAAGAAATVSVPLPDPARHERVADLIESDQRRLLAEVRGW